MPRMGLLDEGELFRALEASGARVLLIGRRALIVLGAPVLTADYDLWIPSSDIEKLNRALEPLELYPNYEPEQARRRGRYVLENDERVDVLVARQMSTQDGQRTSFDEVWSRRRSEQYDERTMVAIPSIADLITTKKWAMRQKDLVDIQFLEALRLQEDGDDA